MEVIGYRGELPKGILGQKLSEDDFYTPEEMRDIILKSFPPTEKELFYGLDYICIGEDNIFNVSFQAHNRDAFKVADIERILKKFIPDYEGTDLKITIHEKQSYNNLDNKYNFLFDSNLTCLDLTEYGYSVGVFGLFQSTIP